MNLFRQLPYFMVPNFQKINTYTILIRGIQAHKSNGIRSLRAKRNFKLYINKQMMKQQRSRPNRAMWEERWKSIVLFFGLPLNVSVFLCSVTFPSTFTPR